MLAVAGARMPRSCRRLHAPLPLLLLLLLFPLCCLPAETEAERLSPYFGTKSRYEEVNRHLLHDPLSLGPTSPPEQQQQQQQPGSCAPLQLSAVVRHGTRFPTRKQIQKLALLHRQVGGGGGGSAEHRPPPCPAAQSLASWAMWYEAALDGRLAPRGHHDMDTLAQRLTARFPELLLGPQRRFAFVSSSKHRCVDSCAAFREGLSQGTSERPEPAKNGEPLLMLTLLLGLQRAKAALKSKPLLKWPIFARDTLTDGHHRFQRWKQLGSQHQCQPQRAVSCQFGQGADRLAWHLFRRRLADGRRRQQ